MQNGHFYFLTDDYFTDFQDNYLMSNKEAVNGRPHNRPCFFAFQEKNTGLYWMIPISSQIEKFQKICDAKVKKYGKCNTILFGNVLGQKRAFLIQNMCPVSEKYIGSEYTDASSVPVRIDGVFEAELLKNARRVLYLQRQGRKLIFPDVLKIEADLLNSI